MIHVSLIYISVTQHPGKANTLSLYASKGQIPLIFMFSLMSIKTTQSYLSLCSSIQVLWPLSSECYSVNSSQYQRHLIRGFSLFCFFPHEFTFKIYEHYFESKDNAAIRRDWKSCVQNMDTGELMHRSKKNFNIPSRATPMVFEFLEKFCF